MASLFGGLFGGGAQHEHAPAMQTIAAPELEPVAEEPSPPDDEALDQAAKVKASKNRHKANDSRNATIMTDDDDYSGYG